ncbi:hypothetical protein [Streptomyces luteireticuli]|uniref:Uncharacterized protein n=1 Tax=Streptomyces luteireticuli TaxID=173858 RepID=A0ABN0YR96_9ACTN
MTEKDPFEQIVGELGHDWQLKQMEQRGILAISAARIAGILYQDAVAHGVGHDLAHEASRLFLLGEMQPEDLVLEEGDTSE